MKINIDKYRYCVILSSKDKKEVIMEVFKDEIKMLKTIADSTRIQILDVLSCKEMCACEILELLTISQSTLSHHMKVLIDSGLVKSRKEATWMHYSVNYDKVNELHCFIDKITKEKQDCICYTKKGDQKC